MPLCVLCVARLIWSATSPSLRQIIVRHNGSGECLVCGTCCVHLSCSPVDMGWECVKTVKAHFCTERHETRTTCSRAGAAWGSLIRWPGRSESDPNSGDPQTLHDPWDCGQATPRPPDRHHHPNTLIGRPMPVRDRLCLGWNFTRPPKRPHIGTAYDMPWDW